MSSLRLALKQSLQETSAQGACSSSDENEFNGGEDDSATVSQHRQENDDWKVEAPSEALIQRAVTLGTAARDYVTPGLRVKVQFDHKNWYGGRISAVSKDASRIRIHYDDGSTEISRFPNGVIIDATNNGEHEESVRMYAKFFELGEKDLLRTTAPTASSPPPAQQPPLTPKPEKKLQLSKTMTSNDAFAMMTLPAGKLSIAAMPGLENTEKYKGNGTPKAPPQTPTTPGSPDGNKPKRKRGRPRKHPLPLDANGEIVLPPRSPHIPKKKTSALPISSTTSTTTATTANTNASAPEPKKLSIRIPVPDKIKQSLQTPKETIPLVESPAVIVASKKPSPSPRDKKKIKQKRSEEEDESVPRGRKKKRLGLDYDDVKWVRCDACFKWRIIPKSAVVAEEEKWYCVNNIYDPKRASCDVPQQALKHKYKKKRQSISEGQEGVTATVAPPPPLLPPPPPPLPPPPEENVIYSVSPPPAQEETVPVKRRNSPLPMENELASDDAKTKRTGKRPLRTELEDEPTVAKRPRGRPRRNKEIIHQKTEVSETDNLEWVQCETCGKWRKIAPHISATDLPEVWTCEMNDWNPASASCDAPEDKAEGLQDTGVFAQTGCGSDQDNNNNNNNKLTYRHLIFGAGTGRRVNRPVSERTRAAESIFSVQFEEEDAPTKVLYSDSTAFVCRGRSNHLNHHHRPADHTNNRVSVLQLMSKSNLWKELHATSKSISSHGALSRKIPPNLAVYSYESLPRDIQQPIKDLILLLLSYESFSVNEILQKSRKMSSLDIPEHCRKALIACTENVIYTTLYQLVKEGKVESVYRKENSDARLFRRVLSNRAEFRRSVSRCLKIAKPWKQQRSSLA